MFTTLAVFLVIAAGLMAFSIKDAMNFRDWDAIWLRSALTLPLAVVAGMACWALIHYPKLAAYLPPSNMGNGWDCANLGKGSAVVCFKQQTPK